MHRDFIQRLSRPVIGTLAVFVLVLFTQAAGAGATAASTSVVFAPSADAYVDRSHPNANFGRTQLIVDRDPLMRPYLRFVVSGLTATVTRATLRFYAITSSSAGFEVHFVPKNNWSEMGITYDNAPPYEASAVANSGPITGGTWVNLDVTALVQGNGIGSIALVGRGRDAVTIASREAGGNAPQLLVQSATAPQPGLRWSGNMETGDMTQWFAPATTYGNLNGGGIFNSGIANAVPSNDYAHSGRYSAKLLITTPNNPTSAARLFRWRESENYSAAYYSAWFYFPQVYTPTQFWNIFQFKSKDSSGNDDPFWILNVGNRPASGNMFLYLYYWQSGTGPTPNQVGPASYSQSLMDLPAGRWVHLEAFLKQASDFTGHVTVWQDGKMIFDQSGVKTKYRGGDNQWSVNNYSNGIVPSTAAIYVDDAAISTSFIP
jgi:hypothetical protein